MKKQFYAAMAALMVGGFATAQTVSVIGLDGNAIATYDLDQVNQIVFTPGEEPEPNPGTEIEVPEGYQAVEFEVGGEYEGYYFPIDQEAVADALGVPSVTTTYVNIYLKQGDELSDNYTANAPGFWINKYGEICSWGAEDCAIYIEYYGDDGEYGFGLGQFKGTMQAGETLELTLVMVGDEGQVEFPFFCYWVAAEEIVDNVVYTCDGTATQALDTEGTYATVDIDFDATAVAEALGVDDLSEAKVVMYNPDGELILDQTANNGFWINADGSVGTWGEASFFIEYHTTLVVGQMPEVCEPGTYKATIGFAAHQKIATVDVTYTVTQ